MKDKQTVTKTLTVVMEMPVGQGRGLDGEFEDYKESEQDPEMVGEMISLYRDYIVEVRLK